jgi:hypothetical protein
MRLLFSGNAGSWHGSPNKVSDIQRLGVLAYGDAGATGVIVISDLKISPVDVKATADGVRDYAAFARDRISESDSISRSTSAMVL